MATNYILLHFFECDELAGLVRFSIQVLSALWTGDMTGLHLLLERTPQTILSASFGTKRSLVQILPLMVRRRSRCDLLTLIATQPKRARIGVHRQIRGISGARKRRESRNADLLPTSRLA